MESLETLIIIGGIIIGNELLISLFRSHHLSNHKMVNRKHQHKTQKNHATTPPDKERT